MHIFFINAALFFPTTSSEEDVIKQHAIPRERVIRRIGIDRKAQLQSLLSMSLLQAIYPGGVDNPKLHLLAQRDRPEWPGGYFGYSGRSDEVAKVAIENPERMTWRKEYLPGPTKLVATTLCASLAGSLRRLHPADRRLRITLHRAVSFGQEEVLQQSCDYFGQNVEKQGGVSPSGRTFPASNATIGLAYRTRQIVRSKRDVNEKSFQRAMKELDLQFASAKMAKEVAFVLAIPVLEPAEPHRFIGPTPVAAVLYIDSTAPDFFIEDEFLQTITATIEDAFHAMEVESKNRSNRIVNVPLSGLGSLIPPAEKLSSAASQAFELVRNVSCPTTIREFQLNFEYTDFVPIIA